MAWKFLRHPIEIGKKEPCLSVDTLEQPCPPCLAEQRNPVAGCRTFMARPYLTCAARACEVTAQGHGLARILDVRSSISAEE